MDAHGPIIPAAARRLNSPLIGTGNGAFMQFAVAVDPNRLRERITGENPFIIAHRLSTVRCASRILVIEHGRITESGNHTELIAERGRYFRLYTNQFAREGQARVLHGGPA